MPVRMKWDNQEQTVFLITSEGQWTLDEYYDAFKAATDEINQVDHQVILIIDQAKSAAPPALFMSAGRFSTQNKSPNIVLTIMVGMPAFNRALMSVMMKVIPQMAAAVQLVDTLEEARQVAQVQAT